jgi:hypothetical protein
VCHDEDVAVICSVLSKVTKAINEDVLVYALIKTGVGNNTQNSNFYYSF